MSAINPAKIHINHTTNTIPNYLPVSESRSLNTIKPHT